MALGTGAARQQPSEHEQPQAVNDKKLLQAATDEERLQAAIDKQRLRETDRENQGRLR